MESSKYLRETVCGVVLPIVLCILGPIGLAYKYKIKPDIRNEISDIAKQFKRVLKVNVDKAKLYELDTFKFKEYLKKNDQRYILGEVYKYDNNLNIRYFIIKMASRNKRLIKASDVIEIGVPEEENKLNN